MSGTPPQPAGPPRPGQLAPAEPAGPPPVPAVPWWKMTAAEAEKTRAVLSEGHPVAEFLANTDISQLGAQTATFKKIQQAASSQVGATRAVLRLQEMEGRLVRVDALRARVAELQEREWRLCRHIEQLEQEVAASYKAVGERDAAIKELGGKLAYLTGLLDDMGNTQPTGGQ